MVFSTLGDERAFDMFPAALLCQTYAEIRLVS